jgi:hypothetical protein
MAPRKTKKEQTAYQRAALPKKAAAQQSKAMQPEVSLQGDNKESTSRLEEVEACKLTTDKEEGLIQSNKDSKRKSTPPNIQATKGPKKVLISSENSKQRKTMWDHARNQKEDRIPMIQLETNRQQNQVNNTAQPPAELRAVLIKTEGQLVRAEQQVRAISKTRVDDMLLKGQVHTWKKECYGRCVSLSRMIKQCTR